MHVFIYLEIRYIYVDTIVIFILYIKYITSITYMYL